MKVIRDVNQLPRVSDIAFVPTMGALHAGHQSLIRKARSLTEHVVTSVYINPLQFENSEDLAKYPKTPMQDEELAREAGAAYLWFPTQADLYPHGIEQVSAGEIGAQFEGKSRSGHFDGVVTVVNALFNAVKPRWALFGEKDLQQLFLIKKMAHSLHPQIDIVQCETVREVNGLALSSRNIRLTPASKEKANVIARALHHANSKMDVHDKKTALIETLKSEPDFSIDYAEIIDGDTFEIANNQTINQRAIVAGWIDGVRLIDTMSVSTQHQLVSAT